MTENKPDKLTVSICIPLTPTEKALFNALAAEVERKPAQLGRIILQEYIREHMKAKEAVK
jgi:hypothetical protein